MAIESRGDLAPRHGSIGRIAVAHSCSYRSDNPICTRTIPETRNAQRPELPSLLLRDENLPNRMRPIGPFLQVPRQCSQPPVHPERIDVRDRLAVHPRPRRRCVARPARRLRARRRATPCRSESRTGSPELPALSHVAPSGVAELSPRLLGSRQSSCPFLRHALLSN